MNLCEIQHDERRDREAAALRVARQSLSPRVLPCTDTGSRTVRVPGPGGVVTTRRVCPFHEGEINAALAASPPPVASLSVPEIVRDRPNRRPPTTPSEDSPMSRPRLSPDYCVVPGCGRPATCGRFCAMDSTRRKRLGLPADVDGAKLDAAWAAASKRGKKGAAALVVAPPVTSPEEPVTGQAAVSNLDQALGELRELLDMDGYSPAAIVQRAAATLRLAKDGVPNDPVREIVVRLGLPATTTGEKLVEYVEKETAGRIAEQENARSLAVDGARIATERDVLRTEREALRTENARLGGESAVKLHNAKRRLDFAIIELAYHLGLELGVVDAWLKERIEHGDSKHLACRSVGARAELEATCGALINELAYQTGRAAADVEKWLHEPDADHLGNLHANYLERRRAKIEEELNEALEEASKARAGAESLSLKCARLEAENDALAKDLDAQAFVAAAPPAPLPSTVDITLPGGLRVLIQPVGASS